MIDIVNDFNDSFTLLLLCSIQIQTGGTWSVVLE